VIKARALKRTGRKVYDVRLRDPHGKVYTRTLATKRAAEDFEASERAARARGAWVDPRLASRSFASVTEDWLAADRTERASSLARDRSILAAQILAAIGKKAIGSANRADLQLLVNSWAATYSPRPRAACFPSPGPCFLTPRPPTSSAAYRAAISGFPRSTSSSARPSTRPNWPSSPKPWGPTRAP
jgi:hypothetical protein